MTRVLFVDDEPQLLTALQRMLRVHRRDWQTFFARSGDAALTQLAATPVDVVVTDMRMPGMDGATLLGHVRDRHPDVVRIVLSGQTELESALRALPVAHQLLTKPCDPETLEEVIARAAALRALLADDALRAQVGDMHVLPSLPRVYATLTELLASPTSSMADIVRVVEQDVAIYAKVLQLVNSPFFGLARRVTNIQQAVGCLGTAMLRNLALSVEVFQAFGGDHAVPGFSLEALQDHLLLVARVASRLLDDKRQADDAFMAGMLHDVGKLVLATRAPAELAAALREAARDGVPVHTAEARRGPVTHAETGAYLLGLWGLPYPIVEAVAHHHTPARAGGRHFDVLGAVHVADALVHEERNEPAALDVAWLEAVGVADRLPRWRAIAAAQAEAA